MHECLSINLCLICFTNIAQLEFANSGLPPQLLLNVGLLHIGPS